MTSKKSGQLELTPAEIDALKVDLGDQLWPAPSDPMAVARRLLTDHSHAGLTTLRHWRAGWANVSAMPLNAESAAMYSTRISPVRISTTRIAA